MTQKAPHLLKQGTLPHGDIAAMGSERRAAGGRVGSGRRAGMARAGNS